MKIRITDTLTEEDIAAVSRQFSGQELYQGALSRSVGSDYAYPVLLVDVEGHIGQHRLGPVVFIEF